MASATLVHEINVAARAQATGAAWWRRGHSYAFIAVAVAEVVLTWGVVRLVKNVVNGARGFENIAMAAMIGFLFAQCFLLGLWAALGGLPTVPRWLIVGTVSTVGALAVTCELLTSEWEQFLSQGPVMALLAGLTMAGIAVVLLPLRRLAGWRVDFDAAYHPSTGRRRGQIELMDFAALFCAVALPLTLCRSLIELMGNEAADIGVIIPIFGALVLVTAAPAAYAVLARRGVWIARTLGSVWVVAVCIVQSLLAARFPDLDVFDGRSSVWGLNWTVFAFHCSVAATVALPLGVLRLLGLKIITIQ
jgi:hypothetical protein